LGSKPEIMIHVKTPEKSCHPLGIAHYDESAGKKCPHFI
jgi:hypothetical protein